ncbi:MAG: hypothetical protein WAM24_09150 [Ignavibacteriaceae bacterium]
MKSILSLIISCLLFALMLIGCSSSKETEKKEIPEVKAVEITKQSVVKNKDFVIKEKEFEDRNLIKSEKIKSIDKVSFDLSPDGLPVNGRKTAREQYDSDGFLIELIFFNHSGNVGTKYEYKYNNAGSRIETLRINSEGEPYKRYTYEYNKHINKIKSTCYSITGKMENFYIYEYDKKGNLINDLWFNADSTLEYKIVNKYDTDDKKIESEMYLPNGYGDNKIEYFYDKKGYLIEEVHYNAENSKTGITQSLYKNF